MDAAVLEIALDGKAMARGAAEALAAALAVAKCGKDGRDHLRAGQAIGIQGGELGAAAAADPDHGGINPRVVGRVNHARDAAAFGIDPAGTGMKAGRPASAVDLAGENVGEVDGRSRIGPDAGAIIDRLLGPGEKSSRPGQEYAGQQSQNERKNEPAFHGKQPILPLSQSQANGACAMMVLQFKKVIKSPSAPYVSQFIHWGERYGIEAPGKKVQFFIGPLEQEKGFYNPLPPLLPAYGRSLLDQLT